MKREAVNWDEVRDKYESGAYTYRRLAEEYGVGVQTVYRHAGRGRWQRDRAETERQMLRRCLKAAAEMLETAAKEATERLENGEGSLKEVKELGGLLQTLVGAAEKLYRPEKGEEAADSRIEVVLSAETEELSG